jgi:hypothetical protein
MNNKFFEELLEIDFHDSHILDVRSEEDKLIIVIDIDTYWYPGKPFGILTLVNPENHKGLLDAWKNGIIEGTVSTISIKRRKSVEPHEPVCHIEFIEGSKFDIPSNNFWLDRFETFEEFIPGNYS